MALLEPLEEWTSIANIVVEKDFEQQFREHTSLQPFDDEDDTCKKFDLDLENCKKQAMCVVYTDSKENQTCVPKKRVKSFSKGTKILGVNGARFEILYTKQYGKYVYVYILLSIDTNILYVLWSSKVVLQHSVIVSINTDELIDQLIKIMETVKYVVFCGHSMGCVLSQYLAIKCVGYLDISKIYVIGSGPFSWMEDDELKKLTSNYQNRIHIFVVGYLDKQKYCVDPFFFRNVEKENYREDNNYIYVDDEENDDEVHVENEEERFDINQYYPCKVLVIPKPVNFDKLYDFSEDFTCIGTKIIRDKIEVAKFEPSRYDTHWRYGCPLHELKFYMKCLKEVYIPRMKQAMKRQIEHHLEEERQKEERRIKQKIGGRRKKTKHIKRRNRKKYTKKSKI